MKSSVFIESVSKKDSVLFFSFCSLFFALSFEYFFFSGWTLTAKGYFLRDSRPVQLCLTGLSEAQVLFFPLLAIQFSQAKDKISEMEKCVWFFRVSRRIFCFSDAPTARIGLF